MVRNELESERIESSNKIYQLIKGKRVLHIQWF